MGVVVAWHTVGDQPVVVTPATWRFNFGDDTPATVTWRGRRRPYLGKLHDEPAEVASAINAILRHGTSPRALALHIPAGHVVTEGDVTRTRRTIICFQPTD